MPRVMVTANMSLCMGALDQLRACADVVYVYPADRQAVLARIGDCDFYMGSPDIRIDREVLDKGRKLKAVCTCSTGTDHIDLIELERRGIEVHSIKREYELLDSFTAVAEMAWGLLLSCLRRIPHQFERAKAGELRWWNDSQPVPFQLSGKTLGVLGVGRLGRMSVEHGKAFRMRVIYCDLREIDIPGAMQVDFDTLVRESDVLMLHVHLTDQTHHIIGRDVLARMKRGSVLINTSRGDLVDEEAMIDALESGQLFAAGLDVFHNEWDPKLSEHRLFQYAATHHNLIITPHLAGATVESITGSRLFMANKLTSMLQAEHDQAASRTETTKN